MGAGSELEEDEEELLLVSDVLFAAVSGKGLWAQSSMTSESSSSRACAFCTLSKTSAESSMSAPSSGSPERSSWKMWFPASSASPYSCVESKVGRDTCSGPSPFPLCFQHLTSPKTIFLDFRVNVGDHSPCDGWQWCISARQQHGSDIPSKTGVQDRHHLEQAMQLRCVVCKARSEGLRLLAGLLQHLQLHARGPERPQEACTDVVVVLPCPHTRAHTGASLSPCCCFLF